MSAKGFGLIEVLISLIIIGVGLLGMASLNNSAYQTVLEAELRQTAVYAAMDLANRMKMNSTETILGATSIYNDVSRSKGVNNSCTTTTSNCTAASIAAYDLYVVYNLLGNRFPLLKGGQIQVCLDNSGAAGTPLVPNNCNGIMNGNLATYMITVTWTGSNGVTENYITSITP